MMPSRNWLRIGLLTGCLTFVTLETQSLSPTPRSNNFFSLQAPSMSIVHAEVGDRQGRNWHCGLLQKTKSKKDEEELESFEDDLLVLTRLSEQMMLNQLSLRSFRCQERIVVTEHISKPESSTKREFVSAYEVKRKAETRANAQLTFVEARKSGRPAPQTDPLSDPDFPLVENPFSGFVIRSFSFENRLANDFKKAPNEKMAGRDCLKFAFETVPELAESSISVMGIQTALRQRGFIWVDADTHHLVRVSAQLTKLPKGCKGYEYDVSFSSGRLFNKEIQLPTHVELKVQFKDRSYEVEQHYKEFEPL
jgi:hypothetical protein